jgi:transcriptional regulator with XRE-family HTH domain
MSIIDDLRRAIRTAERKGITRYRLAQLSGVEQAVLSKLMHGKRTVGIATAEKIAAALGKQLVMIDR